MASTKLPVRYEDPEYQEAHRVLFASSVTQPLKSVLPPDLIQAEFDSAVREFVTALGSDGVLAGDTLKDYIDPYELYEDNDSERRVVSAAVV
jgi:hypothetical protein